MWWYAHYSTNTFPVSFDIRAFIICALHCSLTLLVPWLFVCRWFVLWTKMYLICYSSNTKHCIHHKISSHIAVCTAILWEIFLPSYMTEIKVCFQTVTAQHKSLSCGCFQYKLLASLVLGICKSVIKEWYALTVKNN